MKVMYSLSVVFFLFSSIVCTGQNLTEKNKKQIAKRLITQIKDNYVLQDSVAFIIPKIKESYNQEAFKKKQTAAEFALYLTKLLRTLTRDAHFGFIYHPQVSDLLLQAQDGDTTASNTQLDALLGDLGGNPGPIEKHNFFFRKAELLEGNIGYLKLDQIPALESSQPTLDAAMAFLSNSDAFILDLRGNRGGAGGFIPYFMSYFFPKKKKLLYKREMPAPAWDSISYHYTHEQVNGKRMDNTPLYILTDQATGSAATNMAYTLQSFERATIIGENTGSGYRGAHSASLFPLYHGIVGLIPIGRVVNAKTNTNWRVAGVHPDIPANSKNALHIAHIKALEDLLTSGTDEAHQKTLKNILKDKQEDNSKRDSSTTATGINLEKYVGTYEGGRTIWVEGDQLKFQRKGGSPLHLKWKEGHTYKIYLPSSGTTNPSLPSVRFHSEPNGLIESLTLEFEDGRAPLGPYKKES